MNLSPAQKKLILVLAGVIAASRLLALSHSHFDWDEALFIRGVANYEVTQHQPHPPGYPLFIAAAKGVRLIGVPEFRALQVVVLIGAFFIFPALFFLAREVGFDFATSVSGSALFSFLPNVWLYSGTAFSDIPTTTLVFAACALLLRGRRDARSYILGAAVLGLAAGFRPLSLLIGAVPALIATYHRLRYERTPWRQVGIVILAMVLGGGITTGSYAGAALASHSVADYIDAVRTQKQYVREVDSFHSPERPPLRRMARVFFLWPTAPRFHAVSLAALATISAILALIQRRGAPLLMLAIFTPVAVMTWLNLDFAAASRYAISYMAVHAMLAADTLALISRGRVGLQAALTAAVIAVFAVWLWPGMSLQRTTDPPPIAALEWVRRNIPRDQVVYVFSGIGPQSDVIIPQHNRVFYDEQNPLPSNTGQASIVDLNTFEGAHNFVWSRKSPLWKVLRRRCFEASVRVAPHAVRTSPD